MRERSVSWSDIGYFLNVSPDAARMALKRADDVQQLGEKIVVKKSKFSTPVLLKVKELARNDSKVTIRDLVGELAKQFPDQTIPSKSTVQRHLGSSGFKMVKLLKKTIIWPRNVEKRLAFCESMRNKDQSYWDRVIWSDETSVYKLPKSQELWIRVHSTEDDLNIPTNPQMHSGGFSVMFWGCFSKCGLGPLVALEGSMNSENYIELLQKHLLPEIAVASETSGDSIVFMQDNAPCHRAFRVEQFLDQNNVQRLCWPPQSPDMNPIENLWAIIKSRRQKKFGIPNTKKDLIEQIFEIWDAIEPELIEKLANSANKRIMEVYKRRGLISSY